MRNTKIKGSNLQFDAPANWPEDQLGPCDSLSVLCTPQPGTRMPPGSQPTLQSTWEPSAEELALLNAGHAVLLTVFGSLHPPVAIGVTPEVYAGEDGIPGSDDLEEGVSDGAGEAP
jgi:hypothetical protein